MPDYDTPLQILRDTPTKSMSFAEYERALKSKGALHFGVDAFDIVNSLRWRGMVDFNRDSMGDVQRVWLDETRST
jgi:hypothetical protein